MVVSISVSVVSCANCREDRTGRGIVSVDGELPGSAAAVADGGGGGFFSRDRSGQLLCNWCHIEAECVRE